VAPGSPAKARKVLGWNPVQTTFVDLVNMMVDADLELVKKTGHGGARHD